MSRIVYILFLADRWNSYGYHFDNEYENKAEKRYTEDGQMQQTVQTVAKVGQANANQADEMRTQQPGARMEDTAGSRFKQEDTGEKLEPTKEARIREILEEFLA